MMETDATYEQLGQLQQYLQMVEQQFEELVAAQEHLERLSEIGVGDELLVPVTNGIYLPAKAVRNDRVIINVGADTLVERTPQETKELLEAQSGDLAKVREELGKQFSELYQQFITSQIGREE